MIVRDFCSIPRVFITTTKAQTKTIQTSIKNANSRANNIASKLVLQTSLFADAAKRIDNGLVRASDTNKQWATGARLSRHQLMMLFSCYYLLTNSFQI
jgi:hypothetical protein